ncbi:MAG TPA: archease [Desulfuromonadaceae bacterium]
MSYRFLEDIATADVAFEAWGETREEVFIACSSALLATMVDEPDLVGRDRELAISLEHAELDLLLYSFLAELVFLKDARRLLLHADTLTIGGEAGGYHLEALLRGEEIAPERHRLLVDVKAVTLHRLRVACEDDVWRATVVLDI